MRISNDKRSTSAALIRSVHDQVSRSGCGRLPRGADGVINPGEELRQILRQIVRRKHSENDLGFLRTPLKTHVLQRSRLLC